MIKRYGNLQNKANQLKSDTKRNELERISSTDSYTFRLPKRARVERVKRLIILIWQNCLTMVFTDDQRRSTERTFSWTKVIQAT